MVQSRLARTPIQVEPTPAGRDVQACNPAAAPVRGLKRLQSLHRGVLGTALLIVAVICTIALATIGAVRGWDWHAVYLTALGWAFVFWNSVRILTYLPTIRILLKPGASAEHYSIATWSSWVLSNGTMALYLFEASGRIFDSLVLLNTGNTFMCLITCALIVRTNSPPPRRPLRPQRPGAGMTFLFPLP